MYFQATGNLKGHKVRLAADQYMPLGPTSLPEGNICLHNANSFSFSRGGVWMQILLKAGYRWLPAKCHLNGVSLASQ